MKWATRSGVDVDRAACALAITAALFDGLYEHRRRALLLGRDPA